MPLLVKNALGALPLFLLFVFLIYGYLKKCVPLIQLIYTLLLPLFMCGLYYGTCYWKSPEAFQASFFVSVDHFGNYEGWKRPWHYFITHYLPNRYLQFMWWPFVGATVIAIGLWNSMANGTKKFVLTIFFGYFLLNLIAVSFVTSKSANFILQGYLFILFFVLYILISKLINVLPGIDTIKNLLFKAHRVLGVVLIAIFLALFLANILAIKNHRTEAYNYVTQNEHFYHFGELSRTVNYSNERSLYVLDTDTLTYSDSIAFKDPDYWLRYYILFNTGSEARRIEEIIDFNKEFSVANKVKYQYDKVYLVTNDYLKNTVYQNKKTDFQNLGKFKVLAIRKSEFEAILNLRADNASYRHEHTYQ